MYRIAEDCDLERLLELSIKKLSTSIESLWKIVLELVESMWSYVIWYVEVGKVQLKGF